MKEKNQSVTTLMIMRNSNKENSSEKERKLWRITSIIGEKEIFKESTTKEKKEKRDNLDYREKTL